MFVLLHRLRSLRTELRLPRGPGASLALRHVDSGSCNGCEHELTAAFNPYYDLQRFGLSVVASPRHADVLLVTGTPTLRMRCALLAAYEAMPEPRLVAALGDCALGGNLLGDPAELTDGLETLLPIHVRIPGCPPDPERIAAGLLGALQNLRSTASRLGKPPYLRI